MEKQNLDKRLNMQKNDLFKIQNLLTKKSKKSAIIQKKDFLHYLVLSNQKKEKNTRISTNPNSHLMVKNLVNTKVAESSNLKKEDLLESDCPCIWCWSFFSVSYADTPRGPINAQLQLGFSHEANTF